MRAADDVLTVGRHRHRVHRAGVPLEGVDERPVDVVQPDLVVGKAPKADRKVHAVGQRRDAVKEEPFICRGHRDGALVSTVESHRAKVLSVATGVDEHAVQHRKTVDPTV